LPNFTELAPNNEFEFLKTHNFTTFPENSVPFQGYECIDMDYASTEACSAHETSYVDAMVDFTSNPSDALVYQSCFNTNGQVNSCATRVCTIEIAFLRDWWAIQSQVYRGQYDAELATYQHVHNGAENFVPEDSCSIIKGAASQRQCCGNYPTRAPFRVDGAYGERACCDGQTYNTANFDCCDGDTIALSCA
jgi:hypothetical protein